MPPGYRPRSTTESPPDLCFTLPLYYHHPPPAINPSARRANITTTFCLYNRLFTVLVSSHRQSASSMPSFQALGQPMTTTIMYYRRTDDHHSTFCFHQSLPPGKFLYGTQSVVQPRNRPRIIPSDPTRALDLEQIVERPMFKRSSRSWLDDRLSKLKQMACLICGILPRLETTRCPQLKYWVLRGGGVEGSPHFESP